MSYKVDQRGSKDQRTLYQYLAEIYSSFNIIYEQPLYELGQRIDIYIPNLAIAIEYNGRQHYDFIPHFHKDLEGFKEGLRLDQQKREYLTSKGIKLVEIPYNKMVKDKEELQELINSIAYPDIPYEPLPDSSEKQDSFKEQEKTKRLDASKRKREHFKEDKDVRKTRLEKERQFRKERYKKMKENK